MKRKKEKLLDKFVKKDYNNDLEEILSKKIFQEEVKNLLLDILYKIEVAYKDYETVKKNVLTKEEYIENIILDIKDNCESINFLKKVDIKTRTYAVNKERKQILCYPISNKLLYCLAKIQKCDDIIKVEPEIINRTLTNTINIGNNINMVEPLRDFNGYSWNISIKEMGNFYYNLIYQDLIILIGNKILEEWTNAYDGMIDYMELFTADLEKKYGKEIEKKVLEYLKNLSILMEMDTNKPFKKEIKNRKYIVEEELKKMKNKEKYLEDISKAKKQLAKDIKNIDLILSNKEMLAKEYKIRNEKLPLEQKIFSKRILTKKMKEERNAKIIELQELNKKMNSKNYLNSFNQYKKELKYIKLADVVDVKKELFVKIIEFQEIILQAFDKKIKKAVDKDELLKILYELRYYNLIPIDNTKKIYNITKLKRNIDKIENQIIDKMYKLKMINEICSDQKDNYKILKNIFTSNILKLEDIHIKVIKGKDEKYYIQFLDENIEDEAFITSLKKEDFKVKTNRKTKIFI